MTFAKNVMQNSNSLNLNNILSENYLFFNCPLLMSGFKARFGQILCIYPNNNQNGQVVYFETPF